MKPKHFSLTLIYTQLMLTGVHGKDGVNAPHHAKMAPWVIRPEYATVTARLPFLVV